MLDPQKAIEVVRGWWKAVDNDFDACEAAMAPDIIRIGPQVIDESDISRGRRAYGDFIRSVIGQMPSYHNTTHEAVASPDGRRVYIHCTEWSAPGSGSSTEVEVPLVMICTVNDDYLIEKVDIYWKTPSIPVDWTIAESIAVG